MLVIGLTGGIGSGKTVAANDFAELGAPIIDADLIARQIVEPGTPAHQAIRKHFGSEIITLTSQINRSHLRKLIFSNPAERLWIENLLHPLIFAEIKKQIAAYHAPYVIVVIPLLVETMPHPYLDRILVIDTDPQNQISRAVDRDHQSPQEVEQILISQVTREQRLLLADDIILNDDDLKALKAKVLAMHEHYLDIAKK
jgi:dephospho-CoA kinase